MNKSVFAKTPEDVREYNDVKIANGEDEIENGRPVVMVLCIHDLIYKQEMA